MSCTDQFERALTHQAHMSQAFLNGRPDVQGDLLLQSMRNIFGVSFTQIPMAQTVPIFKRSTEVVAANVGDKSLLLHITDWVYLELNESGSRVWELLGEGRTLDDLVGDLCREFKVDIQTCSTDTSELLEMLEAKRFIQRA